MPTMQFTNPLRSLDLTKFDVRSFDPRKITLPNVDLRKTVAPAAKIARDAAYVAVGLGVIATQIDVIQSDRVAFKVVRNLKLT
ncbi:MAG: hypothetical protein EBU98_04690, partial [Actinobacteria bacterium]|nr:hypothetical protein [Actinomycetota bacterium]